jgi:hypothetical protein
VVAEELKVGLVLMEDLAEVVVMIHHQVVQEILLPQLQHKEQMVEMVDLLLLIIPMVVEVEQEKLDKTQEQHLMQEVLLEHHLLFQEVQFLMQEVVEQVEEIIQFVVVQLVLVELVVQELDQVQDLLQEMLEQLILAVAVVVIERNLLVLILEVQVVQVL